MSFDIQWENICNDGTLAVSFREFLNSKLSALSLPHYLANLQVVDFKMGDVAPDITIRDIDVPFKEFYESLNEEDDDDVQREKNGSGENGETSKRPGVSARSSDERKRHSGKYRVNENVFNDRKEYIRRYEEEEGREEDSDDDYDHEYDYEDDNTENDDGDGDDEKVYFDDNSRVGDIRDKINTLRSKSANQYNDIRSIPMTPKSNFIQSRSSSPSNPLFINGPQALLTPRASSAMTPTLGHLGVGITGFGMAGSTGRTNMMRSSTNLNSSGDSENDYFQPFANHTMYGNEKSLNNILQGMSGMEINDNDPFYESDHRINQDDANDVSEKYLKDHDTSMDIQLSVDIDWDSQLYIEIFCDLLVNYPAPEFIRLPVRLKITDLKIHSLMAIAYISKRVFISFLCDIDDSKSEMDESMDTNNESRQDSKKSTTASSATNNIKTNATKGKERIDILKNMKIEGEIGNIFDSNDGNLWRDSSVSPTTPKNVKSFNWNNNSTNGLNPPYDLTQTHSGSINIDDMNDNNGLVLRNIGKIEKFLINAFRGIIIEELAWPGWIELDFNEASEDEDEERENQNDEETKTSERVKSKNHTRNNSVRKSGEIEDFERTVKDNVDRSVKNVEEKASVANAEPYVPDEHMSRVSSSREEMSLYSNDSYFTDNE